MLSQLQNPKLATTSRNNIPFHTPTKAVVKPYRPSTPAAAVASSLAVPTSSVTPLLSRQSVTPRVRQSVTPQDRQATGESPPSASFSSLVHDPVMRHTSKQVVI